MNNQQLAAPVRRKMLAEHFAFADFRDDSDKQLTAGQKLGGEA